LPSRLLICNSFIALIILLHLTKTSSSGTFLLDSGEARVRRLSFRWSYRKTKKPRSFKEHAKLVRVPRDLRALDVRLRRPHLSQFNILLASLSVIHIVYRCAVELGTSSHLLVVLHTGRNHLTKATIKLSGPAGIQFRYQEAVLQSGGESVS